MARSLINMGARVFLCVCIFFVVLFVRSALHFLCNICICFFCDDIESLIFDSARVYIHYNSLKSDTASSYYNTRKVRHYM